jgi:hypothetical protein
MAETVLDLRRQFCRAAMVSGDIEDRVIAETVLAPWLKQDAAIPGALADERRRVFRMAHVNQQALETGGAFLFRYVLGAKGDAHKNIASHYRIGTLGELCDIDLAIIRTLE